MHIKQITIDGFKSYKNITRIHTLSPNHNVIALRFVLCDAYVNLNTQERQELLHDDGNFQKSSAYIEVVFDNTDHRFPIECNEVVIRRTISASKDEHTFNGKIFPKNKIMDFLESAGFSKHNPYYIVPQGRVASLTNANDADRFNLFKEIAGTGAYEERRNDAIKIMEETNMSRQRVDDSLKQIKERLTGLEEEKKHLKEYQDLELKQRTIQYVMLWKELEEINENLLSLDEIKKSGADEIATFNERLDKIQSIIDSNVYQLEQLKNKINIFEAKKSEISGRIDRSLKIKAGLEVNLQHTKNMNLLDKNNIISIDKALGDLKKLISNKEAEFEKCTTQLNSALNLEVSLNESLQKLTQEYNFLSSQVPDPSNKLININDRKKYFENETANTLSLIASYSTKISSLNDKINKSNSLIQDLNSKIENLKAQVDSTKSDMYKLDLERTKKRKEFSKLNENSREYWRKDNLINLKLQGALKEFESSKRKLHFLLNRDTSEGLDSLQKILKEENIQGCHGALIELFDVESVYDAAVDTAAGKRLFDIVVDSASVASQIISILNKKYSGRLSFIPLDDILDQNVTFKDNEEALNIVGRLKFDKKYKKAFNQIFGKFVICQNLEIASKYIENNVVSNALTLYGDLINSNGYISGGYREFSGSTCAASRTLKASEIRCIESQNEKDNAAELYSEINKQIINLDNEISHLDREHKDLTTLSNDYLLKLRRVQDEYRNAVALLSLENQILETAKAELTKTENKLKMLNLFYYQKEANVPNRTLENIEIELQKIKSDISTVARRRAELESSKNALQLELSENLYRQRDELNISVYDVQENNNADDTALITRKFDNLGDDLYKNEDELEKILQELNEDKRKLAQINSTIAENKSNYNNTKSELDKRCLAMEKCVLKRYNLQSIKDEVSLRVRSMGVLPSEIYEKYRDKTDPELVKLLHEINCNLKNYAYANKNAYEQYHAFTREFEQLKKRKEEHDKSAKAILDLLSNLDHRKGESIARNLRQVCKCFSLVWQELVPTGRGKLVPLRRVGATSGSQDFDRETSFGGGSSLNGSIKNSLSSSSEILTSSPVTNQDDGTKLKISSDVDAYTGVSVQVSFNSPDEHPLRLQQLSGGQKSLVALSLIFAIQKCDPAPFYLFDEIDAALDPQYRVNVAKMIKSLSQNAQFIATTFHTEMLDGADRCYGVHFAEKVSYVKEISLNEARSFIEGSDDARLVLDKVGGMAP